MLEWSRKRGKSFFLVAIAAMVCLRHQRKRVVFGAPTLKHLEEFILPLLEEVTRDCPEDLRPIYNEKTGHWFFPSTGCWVHFFGADDKRKANRGRGPAAIVAIFDECGFTPVLDHVLTQVFRPSMLLGSLFTILGSTPADEPDHEFTRICEVAEANGTLSHQTIYDNPRLTPEAVAKFIEDDARDNGMTVEEYKRSPTFRREYLAERVIDRVLVVMGDDWTAGREAALCEVAKPQFFDAYQAFDMGGVDPHGILFGWWYFEKGWLVIEDELLFRDNETTEQIAEAWKAKEAELYGSDGWNGTLRALHAERTDARVLAAMPEWAREQVEKSEAAPLQPYLRVCDNDIQIARDMSVLHGITCIPTEKTDKLYYVNEFRILMRQGRVKVNPRCRNLDRHMRQTMWANHRMAEYKRKGGEHGDLLDCAVYMARNVRKARNPVPEGYGVDPATQWVRRQREQAKHLGGLVRATARWRR